MVDQWLARIIDVHPLTSGRQVAPGDSFGGDVVGPFSGDGQRRARGFGFRGGDGGHGRRCFGRRFGGGCLFGAGGQQRISAGTTSARNTLIIDEKRGAGANHGVVAVSGPILEAVHAHVDVLSHEDRRERPQVLRQCLEGDSLDLSPGATAILVVGEEFDHLLDITNVGPGAAVGTTAIQTRGGGVDCSRQRRVFVGHLVCRQVERRCERIRTHDSRWLEKCARGAGRGIRIAPRTLLATTARGTHHEQSAQNQST